MQNNYLLHSISANISFENKTFATILFFIVFGICTPIQAQDLSGYDELTVELNVPRLGSTELPVAIKDQVAFLSIKDLFNFLNIQNEILGSKITGYLLNPENKFQIDFEEQEIIFNEIKYILSASDFIVTPTTYYLKSNIFGDIFGLNAVFSFRSLSVKLSTELELPKVRELRLLQMRENLKIIKEGFVADTIIKRNYPLFRAGAIDWGVITTQQTNGLNDNRFNLGIGTMIAGGETNILLNYSTRVPFESRNQFYQWKLVNNENPVFRQVTAGKIFTRATSTLFAPVVGVQFSNTPVVNRRSFGTYTLTDVTEPRWTVELYINNVLVDYTEADASGFYSFEVPLVYGSTMVNLKFYGPYGEERTEERAINIPYSFIPKNELEYTLSAGFVEDDTNSKFGRFNLNYGVGNGLTIGGGVEYLSNVSSGEVMPFLNTAVKFAPNLLFSGEYTFGVKAEGLLSYRSRTNLQIDLNYVNYDEDQTAINFNYLEERNISLSMPIKNRFFSAYTRFSLNQIILPTSEFTTAQLIFSGVLFGVSTNITTYGLFNDRNLEPTIYSTISQIYRLPENILFLPKIQFDYSDKKFTNLALGLEKAVFDRGYLNMSYENNFLRNNYTFQVGFRYLFDFAQTSLTSRIGNQNSTFVQSARGSLFYNDKTGSAFINNRSSVGKAGITIIPFLDFNNNGIKEANEQSVKGLELKNNRGRVFYNKDLSELKIVDLEPYIQLLLEIDPTSIDNIAWKINNTSIQVEPLPNQFGTIYIPISVVGEVSGTVYFKNKSKKTQGLGRVLINILSEDGILIDQVLSEGDGYFTYLGLAPGNYTAVIDPEQLNNLNYSATPSEIKFTIKATEFGDIVDDLEFILEKETN